MIREKLAPVKNLSDWVVKKMAARISAARGPIMGDPCMTLKKPDRRLVTLLTTALMVILLQKSGGRFPHRR
jgi:hypothetical protein